MKTLESLEDLNNLVILKAEEGITCFRCTFRNSSELIYKDKTTNQVQKIFFCEYCDD
jgi:DNA/RNA-binding domain of Phe-tRNA-synthetase-like protein